ncbi:MAG: DUF2764 family protein [Bacteroidales bacterium]|nr:DUF2764 family protein [Bacteroidales bacterium]
MKRNYYCLVAGLPDILFEDSKISVSVQEFKKLLKEELHPEDFSLIASFFWRYDNYNILKILQKETPGYFALSNLTQEQVEELFRLVKDDSVNELQALAPEYFSRFIQAYKDELPVVSGKSWENQCNELYYSWLQEIDNEFVRNWYSFERDLENILTAVNCKKYEMPVEPELIGNNELTEKLIKSSTRDFGISNEFPKLEEIIRSTEETNLIEKEKKIDLIKWDLLDDWSFFHNFSVEKVFSFVIKLTIIERWLKLDKKTGEELFEKLLRNLETGYEFPEEFILKQV